MIVPTEVRSDVEAAIESFTGRPGRVVEASPVSGGSISSTARIRSVSGDSYFLKWSGVDLPGALLAAEAEGLRELAAAGAVRVPEVLGLSGDTSARGSGRPWLLLEWLEPGAPSSDAWQRLGREIAALHRSRSARFGAAGDNFIGSLPQDNRPTADWPEFWRDRRLEPQLVRAEQHGLLGDDDRRRFDELYDGLDDLLGPAADEGASLLHGDLWNGNVLVLDDGIPAVVDPSVYSGHREVDLAMAELFGGFEQGFHHAYRESWPLAPGYAPVRRAVYQLYYLLVHVNLFGGAYVSRTRHTLSEAGV